MRRCEIRIQLSTTGTEPCAASIEISIMRAGSELPNKNQYLRRSQQQLQNIELEQMCIDL